MGIANADGSDSLAPGRVLVVDDEAPNRLLLRELLEGHGYAVVEAVNGDQALALAAEVRPDVILLDVMMPKLDGFEVCRRLKAAPDTRIVPILMVTSLAARQERLEGIRAGASDFVTKPIDGADLLLRVRNTVAAKKLYDELDDQYRRLRELESLRDSLVHMLVHDVRSPLTVFVTYLHLLGMETQESKLTEASRIVIELKALARRMTDMVATVLDVSRMEAGKMPLEPQEVGIQDLIHDAVRALGPTALERVKVEVPDEPVRATVDLEVISRVVINLIGNALKFSNGTTPVLVTITVPDADVEIAVGDTGPGIPAQELDRIFEKFGQAKGQQRNHGTGLGLTFCKLAVEAHGGNIGARSAVGDGSTFWFRLPREPLRIRAAS